MRILVTNDDGINAPGLKVLETIAADLAGPEGEVWVVAPAFEQSGVGHCISYTHPMLCAQMGERRFAAEGSPADCVLAGVHDVMKDTPPNLVLSGVNRGNNSAENTLYSGTIGGAMEAALQGLPAIALSQYYGPANADVADPFEAAAQFGVQTIQQILAADPGPQGPYPLFWNVNFPPVPASEVKGIRLAPQGKRENTRFSVEPHQSPSGRRSTRRWLLGPRCRRVGRQQGRRRAAARRAAADPRRQREGRPVLGGGLSARPDRRDRRERPRCGRR